MTLLSKFVEIDRRFARSARVDADLKGTPPLVGYVMQASVAKALTTLATSQVASKQGAFTWTGPYGGGKSSAALLLANLIAGGPENRKVAQKIAGKELSALYRQAFPEHAGPWHVVAVTGSRMRLRDAIADAASITFSWDAATRDAAARSDEALISMVQGSGEDCGSGTLVVLDELGKLLEHEASDGGDIHLLQDIAEYASRSYGRLVIIGILHQSFEQYAARAARDARQEWAKVQGRFHDIAFLSGADETVALLGRAISCKTKPEVVESNALAVAKAVALRRPTEVDVLSRALAQTWPLNPVTSLLLGPVSRARFAQNERSVFGFLSSAEPNGFQEFLQSTDNGEATYDPARLWDYLSSNFGMALASGNDGGRFSLAFEAIERAAAKGTDLHVALTKAAAIIEFFRNGSGLALADDILACAVPGVTDEERRAAIANLLDWAVLIRQPRLNGYALFAGSDFDLDEAITRSITPIDTEQLAGIPQRVGLGFVTAKRHYFLSGALRTFEIALQLVSKADTCERVAAEILARPERGSGALILLLNDGSMDDALLDPLCKSVAFLLKESGRVIAVGGATEGGAVCASAVELIAVERVFRDHPQLEGDRIARRELAARQSLSVDTLHRTLEIALTRAKWVLSPKPDFATSTSLASVASALADAGFPNTPILKSELLQRDRPSSNSMAALRDLAHAMVSRHGSQDLGISGYPAELGLYLTVVKPFGLHREIEPGRFDFAAPDDSTEGRSLLPAWSVIDKAGDQNLEQVYRLWAKPPIGLKAGVMPVLALSYMLANRSRVAVYIDGVFQTAIDDVTVDKLLQRPADFRLRKIDRSVRETAFLSGLAQYFGLKDEVGSLPVAQALFQRFEALPSFAARTHQVSADTQLVRRVVLKASDPEAMFFDALPDAFGEKLTPDLVLNALAECEAAYPTLLDELRAASARALGVDPATFRGVAERAATTQGLTNDYNFEAFAARAAAIETGTGDIEGLVSMLLHRPARNWSDRDREQALTEVARYGRRFRELEALAVVRDRGSHTEALALVVGLDPLTPPLMRSFVLTELEKIAAANLADRVLATLRADNTDRQMQLAALARAVASLAADELEEEANTA
ncbi:hypothetical protein [Pseudotabrizicola sp.]|uniref:hypothetical protein n=1 Tax=Pseudotabrizicola sp. TaxID=2939647 RepID=UPI00272F2605|nr:hypothetical protein [Pseudotabrizicola sp.]MDP2082004.1 hypothetical protein [Pseudotabrizicola sp.]